MKDMLIEKYRERVFLEDFEMIKPSHLLVSYTFRYEPKITYYVGYVVYLWKSSHGESVTLVAGD